MRAAPKIILGFAVAVPGLFLNGEASAQANMAHTHVGHVAQRFTDTPANRGLIVTAAAEAAVALEHASMAGDNPGSLENMQLHAGHVIHAIDPTVEINGPGLGYGVRKAATGTIQHTEMAAAVPGNSVTMRILTEQILMSTRGALPLADQIIALAQQIRNTEDVAEAAKLVAEMTRLTREMTTGVEGRGGLWRAEQSASLLRRAEGIGGS